MSAVNGAVVERSSVTARGSLLALPFGLAIVAVTLTYWTIDIVSPALPDIQDDLGLSAASTGLVYSLLFLGRLIGNVPAAWLLVRAGTTGTAIAGGTILVAGTATAALAPGELVLYPARVLQGIGIALLVNACLRAILGSRPGRGAAMTFFTFAATAGGVFGLQSGGILTERIGWRAVFALSVVLAGIVTAAALIARVSAGRRGGPLDHLPAGAGHAEKWHGGIAAPLVFNFLIFFNYSLYVALPLYTEHEFGVSPETNSRLLMVVSIVHLVAAFPVGRLIRSWGAQRSLVLGMLVAMAGTALVYPAPAPAWIALPLVLYGFGQVVASSAGGDIVLHLGQGSTRAIGLVRFSSDLGLVIGPYLTGALSDALGYGAPFVALPALLGIASLVGLRQLRTTGSRRRPA